MSFLNKANWKHYESYFKDYKIGDPKSANELLRKDTSKDLLRELVVLEKNRIWNFTSNPLRSVKELYDSIPLVVKTLNDWDKQFLLDVSERDGAISSKQSAILLRIINSVNVGCYYSKTDRKQFWEMIPKDEVIIRNDRKIDSSNVSEEVFTDETKIIADFKLLKENFDDIMESKLFDFQVLSVNFLLTREDGNAILALPTGSGKSLISIAYAEEMLSNKKVEKVVIFSKLSMIHTWKNEILKHTKNKDLSKYDILNYEKILTKKFTNTENTLVIADEGHSMKGSNTKRFKIFTSYKWKHVVIASATPISNRLSELTALYKLMNKKAPIKNNEVNLSELSETLIRVPKSQLNLPSLTIKDVPIEYENMHEYTLYERDLLEEIEKDKVLAIKLGKKPPIELVKLLYLNMLCSNRNIIFKNSIPLEEQNKFIALKEIIDSHDEDEQIIIWSNFTETLKPMKEMLSDYYDTRLIYGAVKQSERDVIIDDFKNGKFKILCMNQATGSMGLTLTNSRISIFIDRNYSAMLDAQARGRSLRIGQTRDCVIYNLYYADTIEERILEVLKKKESMINEVLESGTSTTDLKIGFKDLYGEKID